jgi:hypothetical protein
MTDSGVLDGSLPDAGRDGGTHFEFCDHPLFKLPIDGLSEVTMGLDMWQDRVVYVKYPAAQRETRNVYLFEIGTCVEHQLTQQARASSPDIWQDIVAWTDHRFSSPEPNYYCSDSFMFDLGTWQEVRTTHDPPCQYESKTNGTRVVFAQALQNGQGPIVLILWEISNGHEIELAPSDVHAAYYAISSTHVVWSGYSGDPQSVGKDVFWYDLAAETTGRVAFSSQHHAYDVFTSGDYLTYLASDQWSMPPWHLVLYGISTNQELMLSENDYAMPFGVIHQNLVVWATTKYNGGTIAWPSDIEMYDIQSGLFRRLTTRESNLRPAALHFPYLAMIDVLLQPDQNMNNWYVANLVELGITDDQGNLLPGGGVIEPPR